MNESATPDATVLLGTDVTGFKQGIDAAQAALTRWGEGVLGSVAGVGEKMMAAWAKVGENLANPIGLFTLPFHAIALAADGLVTVVTAPLKFLPVIGGAVQSAIKGIYDAGAAVVRLIPSAVDGIISVVHRAATVVETVADKLSELGDKTAEELAQTLAEWGGSLTEWIARKLVGESTAARIGKFVAEELASFLEDVFREDMDFGKLNAGIIEAQGNVAELARFMRQIGSSIRETQWDFRDTWDNILRDGRETARDIAGHFSDLKIGDLLRDDFKGAMDQVGIYAEVAFTQAEDYLGRVMARISDIIDRTLNRFRAPLAAAFDFVQRLFEKLGLITAGLGSWGDSIRNASSIGQTLIVTIIGGVARITGELSALLGKIALTAAGILKSAAEFMGRETGVDWLSESTYAQLLAGNFTQEQRDANRAMLRQMQREQSKMEFPGILDAAASMKRFAESLKGQDPKKWAEEAEKWANELIEKSRAEQQRRDAEFELRRQEELQQMIDELPVIEPKAPPPSPETVRTTQAIIANSREASNLIARSQSGGPDNPMERVAAAAQEQIKKQERMAVSLDNIEKLLERMQVVGTV